MKITEQKSLIQARLMNLIKTEGDNFFTKVTSGNKVIHLAYEDTTGFLSFMVTGKDKTYVFVHEKLSDKQREAELKIIFEDKELHYFSSDEIETMKKLAEQQERKKLSFKSINYGDIENIVKNYDLTFGELTGAIDLMDIIKKFNKFDNGDLKWNTACAMAFAFKLGETQGKREERARRRKSQVVGGAV